VEQVPTKGGDGRDGDDRGRHRSPDGRADATLTAIGQAKPAPPVAAAEAALAGTATANGGSLAVETVHPLTRLETAVCLPNYSTAGGAEVKRDQEK
jgi:hypothetical protein